MILYGGLALLCLISGFGLGMYEYELRWRIVNAVHSVRPDLEPFALFSRARSLWRSPVYRIYRDHHPQSRLLRQHTIISLASPSCFVAFAVLLVLAIKHS